MQPQLPAEVRHAGAATVEAHPYESLAAWKRVALESLFSFLIGLALAWLSQFASPPEVTKRINARLFAPLLYSPHLPGGYAATGRDRIAVVTIDDDDLGSDALLQAWPPPLDYYAHLIDGLAAREPKAIFLDVLFLDPRPAASTAAFAAAACRARARGIPVYIAALPREPQGVAASAQSVLLRATTGAGPCIVGVAPDAIDDPFDHTAWEYPLRTGEARSAALALACDARVEGACPEDTEEPMAVIWGLVPAPMNRQLMLDKTDLAPLCRGEWSLGDWSPRRDGAFHWPRAVIEWKQPRCPYNQVVPVRALAGVGFTTIELRDALRHKLLLVGTGFQSHGDTVVSPLHGRLPGVHLHAMALDNLLTYAEHGGYRRAGDFEPTHWTPATAYTVVAVGLLAVSMAVWSWAAERWRCAATLTPLHKRRDGKASTRGFPGLAPLRAAGWAFVHMLTFGKRPRPRPPYTRGYRLGRPWGGLVLALLGVYLLFVIGDRWVRIGPLSMIEYLLFPLGAEFLHLGERSARAWVAVCHAVRLGDAAKAYLRRLPAHGHGAEAPGESGHP